LSLLRVSTAETRTSVLIDPIIAHTGVFVKPERTG
jgi:hypothetical protein